MTVVVKCPVCNHRLIDKDDETNIRLEAIKSKKRKYNFYIKCGFCKTVVGISNLHS